MEGPGTLRGEDGNGVPVSPAKSASRTVVPPLLPPPPTPEGHGMAPENPPRLGGGKGAFAVPQCTVGELGWKGFLARLRG